MSGYSSYGEEPHDQSTVTQRTVITRKIVKQPQKDNIIEPQKRFHEDELKELEDLQRQQQVLVTERQNQASSQHQQQKQEVIDRDSE